MKYLPKTFFICCLVSAAVLLGQSGCSSSAPAPETASTQATPSPSPTIDTATTPTPEPTEAVASSTPESRTASGSAPARPRAGAVDSSARDSRPPAREYERPKPPPPPRTYTLNSGMEISISTASDLSTKTSRSGERFTASLNRAITDGDWVIAKRGAPVEGVIVNSDPGGRVSGVASIAVRLESITLTDGRRLNISTDTYTKQAKSSKKKDAAKIGIGAGIGAAIGAIAGGGKGAAIGAGIGGAGGTGVVLGTRGDPAVISSESELNFRLRSPVTVTKR